MGNPFPSTSSLSLAPPTLPLSLPLPLPFRVDVPIIRGADAKLEAQMMAASKRDVIDRMKKYRTIYDAKNDVVGNGADNVCNGIRSLIRGYSPLKRLVLIQR